MKNIIKPYIQPAFVICVAVLAIAGMSKEIVIEWSGAYLTKEPLPLKKPLDLLDTGSLASYKVRQRHRITNKDVLEQLGTEEYLQWELEDTDVDKTSPVRFCSLFITYYTGNLDQVPHVPEECYVGSGNQRIGSESMALNVEGFSGEQDSDKKTISARYIVFSGRGTNIWGAATKYSVLYFFKVNGAYAGTRTEARAILGGNLFGKYSYFSKFEWKFNGIGSSGRIFPDKADSLAASEKLLSVVLPVMERDHWPDWVEDSGK
ncbi:MAG: hypothetical protein ACYTFK_07785 [Planctomycetota bacterium]|jgi:hypothetical protein